MRAVPGKRKLALLATLALSILAAAAQEAPAAAPPIRFEEIGEAAGARHVHTTRSFGERPKAEVLEMFTDGGAAVAVGDFDGDGRDDLFLTDSGAGRPQHLLRNVTEPGGAIAFEEVTAAAGVGGGNEGDAIVADALWLDYDNDGRRDLLVARFGSPLLYRNLGGEGGQVRFEEVSAAAGLAGAFDNTIAAIAFDHDADGWLDLLLGHYFPRHNLMRLETPHVLPNNLDDADNGGGVSLWRNVAAEDGGRRFVEVTEAAGLAHHTGWSLDLGHADLDDDGDQDVYVAGDYGTDRLFVNDGDGTFTDVTEEAIGFDTKKGMNVDFGDYDRDGRLDVFVTNITDEYMRECNMLWHNEGDGTFLDLARETGTCDSDWGWAGKFADLDNDGWQDLFTVNGLRSAGEENYIPLLLETIVTPGIDFSDIHSYPDIGERTWSGYQRQRLFRNLGDGTFAEVAAAAGVDNDLDGRGVGVLDADGDGRLDLVQTNARQPSLLFHNVSEATGHWVALRLTGGEGSNRDAVGARVTLTAGGERWLREVDGGNGYASQSTLTVHVGLGEVTHLDAVEIRWPSGRVERRRARVDAASGEKVSALPVDALSEIAEGGGEEADADGDGDDDPAERLAALRTLGKALYENPATQYDAVDVLAEAMELSGGAVRDRVNLGLALLRAGREEEGIAALEAAQEQDPSLPHTWFNLGIAAKRAGDAERALAQLERMAELVPDDPITRYNLGVLYKLQGRTEDALAAFERAAELDPYLAGARFQLAAAYRQAGRSEDARRATAEFRELKRLQADDAVGEDLEWSYYAELHDPLDARPAPLAPVAEPRFEATEVAALPGGGGGLALLDADGDRTPDLLAWNGDGARLFLAGRRAAASGLETVAGIAAVAAGDFDDDGYPDLAVATAGGARLWRNRGEGGDGPRFVPHAPALPEDAGRAYHDAVWLDFDQDYDLDLFLLGTASALLRNVGADDAGATRFEARDFPFADGEALSATVVDAVADGRGIDLAVSYAGRPGVLYRDLLGGRYAAEDLPAVAAGARGLLAVDFDNDGWTDLAARGPDGPLLAANARGAGFTALPAVAGTRSGAPFAFLDVENRGAADLAAGGRLARNRGGGAFSDAKPLAPLATPAALAAADFDADGRTDLAALGADGRLRLLANRTESGHRWIGVDLAGKKNLLLAPAAEVEVRAGTLYQKRLYRGLPLVFGLGPHAAADAVRVTWPNGLIQNETRQPAGATARYEEAQRLSGSCPMVFTWNGRGMEFIGDVLGVAPLGAAAGDGVYFQVDHDEVLAISGEQLVPRGGVYDVRLTEELREVGYVDHLQLLAVDHPAEVEVLHNDKFKGPPYPEFTLWGVGPGDRAAPTAAVNQRGEDVLEALLHRDRRYAAGVECNGSGISAPHTLTLDFAGGGEAVDRANVLVLHGWTDWADGSTFMATAQAPAGPALHLPVLRMRDAAGEWRTVVADPGVPAGKPKTIVVELPPWLSASRQLRIESSMCVYWDDVQLAAAERDVAVRVTAMPPRVADLRFRGFSAVEVHPERLQPEKFTYADLRSEAPWNPTPGLYTRFGDVRELLRAVDDRMVVFGAGDELALSFDAAAPPPLPAGWRRDFLLVVDGWAKDGDSNTAYGTAVEPLPHHGMAEYPYGDETPFPDGEAHRRWRDEYQTRRELRLTRSWAAGAAER